MDEAGRPTQGVRQRGRSPDLIGQQPHDVAIIIIPAGVPDGDKLCAG